MCGRTVAIVLAMEESTTPLVVTPDDPEQEPIVCEPAPGEPPVARPLQRYKDQPAVIWPVESARRAQMNEVFVVSSPALTEGVSNAVYGTKRKGGGSQLQLVEADPAALVERTREAASFEMFGIPFGILEIARALAQTELDGYDNVVILNADNVRITADHLYELCLDAYEHPEAEAIASWISWLRRLPYLFSRDFLESMEERGLTSARQSKDGRPLKDRPAPLVTTRDHVFGEEKLAASPVVNERVESFLSRCTMTALEAVQMAKHSLAHPDEKLYAPNQPQSLMGPTQPKPLGSCDALLVNIAKAVVGQLPPSEDMVWADAFGKRCKLDFPLLNDRAHAGKLVYLDSAATTQRLDLALQAQREFDEHENANVYRGNYALSAQSTFSFNDARATIERFIGAQRREIVFTSNTTAAINLVAQAWGEWNIEEGDLIVTALSAHHSAFLPFLMLAQRKGARVECVPYGPDGRLDRQAYRELMAQGPKLVCIAQIGNMFGIVEPVKELAAEAHEIGARFFVDAAQSFAHLELDVSDLGADWVAFSAHKAYGPMGVGALWISPEAFDEMDPLGGGGGTVSHVGTESYYLRPKTIQYEMGTPPISQAVSWAAAVKYLEALGHDNVARHDAVLTRYLVEGLHRIDGVTVMGDHESADGEAGLVSFAFRGVDPAPLSVFLGKLGVDIRSGGHCALPLHASLGMIGSGRVSLGVYTTKDDIDAFLVALMACRSAYGN